MGRGLVIATASATALVAFAACGRSGFDGRGVPAIASVSPIVRGALLEWEPPYRTEVRVLLGTAEIAILPGAAPPVEVGGLEIGTTYSFVITGMPALSAAPLAQSLLTPFPVWAVAGTAASAFLGSGLSPGGDLDGDGDSEILVGQQGLSSVRVYEGSPSGPSTVPSHEWNGVPGSAFGRWVANVGDVDGNGFDDVLVGAHNLTTGTGGIPGTAYLYRGSSGGVEDSPSQVITGLAPNEHFGVHVAPAGDVDDDGFADVLVSAHTHSSVEANEGMVYLLRGGAGGLETVPLWSYQPNVTGAVTGQNSADLIGDVDGDGIPEIGIGEHLYGNGTQQEGRALVFKGGNPPATAPMWTYESSQQEAYYGLSIAAADFNDDGYADVITGGYAWDEGQNDRGRVDLFLGSESGPALAPNATFYGREPGALLGLNVSVLRDVSGDGLPEAIVSAHAEDEPSLADAGAVYVFLGTASSLGLSPVPAWRWADNQAGALAGSRAFDAGDVNADGVPDLLVGASSYDTPAIDGGRAYVFLGREPRSGPRISAGVLTVSTARLATATFASISDLPGAMHRCTWSWDDGSAPEVVDPCLDPSLAAHAYAQDGVYQPFLTVESYDGRRSQALGFALVATSGSTPAALLRAPPGR